MGRVLTGNTIVSRSPRGGRSFGFFALGTLLVELSPGKLLVPLLAPEIHGGTPIFRPICITGGAVLGVSILRFEQALRNHAVYPGQWMACILAEDVMCIGTCVRGCLIAEAHIPYANIFECENVIIEDLRLLRMCETQGGSQQ